MNKKITKSTSEKGGRWKWNLLIAFFGIVFLVALGMLIFQLKDYFTANQMRDAAKDLLETPPTDSELEQLPTGADDKFAKLYAQNNDFIGWISIEGTKIDYPVVQGEDNDYYLRRGMDGKYHRLGTVFADYRCTFSSDGSLSDNTIVYGHSAMDGSYFKDLLKYKKTSYYEEHPVIQFDTMYQEQEWVIIGAFMSGIYESQGELFEYHNFIDAAGEEEFNEFMLEVNRRSYFTTNIPVSYGDSLLTLVTCDYEFDDSRFVVVARKLREGETIDGLSIEATAQPNRFMPDAWYEATGKKNPNQ